jgi:hypothetical protein
VIAYPSAIDPRGFGVPLAHKSVTPVSQSDDLIGYRAGSLWPDRLTPDYSIPLRFRPPQRGFYVSGSALLLQAGAVPEVGAAVEFIEEMDPRSGRLRAANVRPV